MSNSTVISARSIGKTFRDGNLETQVLDNISIDIGAGDQLAIVGSSGSGKSTLLHIMGGLDSPDEGQLLVKGQDIHQLGAKASAVLRNQSLGFVYQFHHLLPEFTAVENVAMPLVIGGTSPKDAQQQARELLDHVGLAHRFGHKPSELSGGERQRTAIARALITKPACLLADEPTGNLDNRTAESIFDLILELNATFNTALIIVTHDIALANRMTNTLTIVDGKLQSS